MAEQHKAISVQGEQKALSIVQSKAIVRATFYGGLIAADVVGMIHAANTWYMLGDVILIALAGAVGMGIVGSVIAGVRRTLSGKSLDQVEKELIRVKAMVERGLIDDDDYQQMKNGILAKQSRRPFEWKFTGWGAIIGTTFAVSMMSNGLALLGGLIGMLVVGTSTTGLMIAQKYLLPSGKKTPALPEQPQYEQLGSRK